jgi:hypothetical protein
MNMGVREFLDGIVYRAGDRLEHQEFPLEYRKGMYPLLRLASPGITRRDRVFLLTAGFHGNETAGPITLHDNIDSIADAVHGVGMKLICYPLINPSGFGIGTRHNIDEERGNNDFLRYELATGDIIDDMPQPLPFRRWHWASEGFLSARLPVETRLMHRLLREDTKHRIIVGLDLHQDEFIKETGAYFYGFGDKTLYAGTVRRVGALMPVLRNRVISSGYVNGEGVRSDALGFIERHDGSLSDLCYRKGVPRCIAVETTTTVPLERACAANLIWIDGLLGLRRRRA